MNNQFNELSKHLLTYVCPNHNIVRIIISSCMEFSLTRSFELQWQGQTVLMTPILWIVLKEWMSNLINKIWEHNVQIYCIFNAELNIVLLHWNKQHLESGIIKRGCCPLNEYFHLFLMFICFGRIQSCIRSNDEPTVLHFGTRLASTCLRSRHLHVVERHTHTMVFWTSFPLVPLHFGDWPRHLVRCHRSESSDHRIW